MLMVRGRSNVKRHVLVVLVLNLLVEALAEVVQLVAITDVSLVMRGSNHLAIRHNGTSLLLAHWTQQIHLLRLVPLLKTNVTLHI